VPSRPPTLAALLECRTAAVLDERACDDGSSRLLIRSDLGGTAQLYEWSANGLRALTDLPGPVSIGRYVPGAEQVVLATDNGGDERHQISLLDIPPLDISPHDAADPPGADAGKLLPVTSDGRYVHGLAGVSRDGRLIAFVSNRRNGVDFDVWLHDLGTGEQRCLYAEGGWCSAASGFSPGGVWLSVLRSGSRPMDDDLLLLRVDGSEHTVVLPHPEQAAVVGPPVWVDDDLVLVSSNVGRDWQALFAHDLRTGRSTPVLERPHDVAGWTSADGSTLLVVGNVDEASRAELFRVRTDGATVHLAEMGAVPLPDPDAVIAFSHLLPDPVLAPDGSSVTFTVSSPAIPGDVWRHDVRTGASTRLTTSPGAPTSDGVARPERHRVPSFDGLQVPVLLYRPADPPGRAPVVLVIHGGPEGQSQTVFSPIVQALAGRGYAVVVPNVRGSTGYGKRYYGLDDTIRRLDSVADLGAIADWLPSAGLDGRRAALWGGSYGGYMVLAGCAFQPERWAAGVDIVGISDLVSFLEKTAGYRRAAREREYGTLAQDREFLVRASPLRSADDIRAPLFVIHGANDPRVPPAEAEQIVASLRNRNVPCELLVYPDEGHGLARLANRLDAYPRAMAFLDAVLQPGSRRDNRHQVGRDGDTGPTARNRGRRHAYSYRPHRMERLAAGGVRPGRADQLEGRYLLRFVPDARRRRRERHHEPRGTHRRGALRLLRDATLERHRRGRRHAAEPRGAGRRLARPGQGERRVQADRYRPHGAGRGRWPR
jgi:dipeptidyl aminopeptidase/acylaminoacyl peptidase